MKKTNTLATRVSAALICLLMLAGLAACKTELPELWKEATYTENKSFGDGAKTVIVKVEAGEKSVEFTIKTDRETLGDALLDHDLIVGEDSAYGIFIKRVNGILVDYDKDKAYWGFFKDGEYMNTGVDTTAIADGEHYELVYTK